MSYVVGGYEGMRGLSGSRNGSLGAVTSDREGFATKLNSDFALLLRPLASAIDGLPISSSQKTMLKTRPIDVLLSLAEPFDAFLADAITYTNSYSGKPVRKVRIPPRWGYTDVDMRVVWPGDAAFAPSDQLFMKRLRMLSHVMLLMLQDPVNLTRGFAKSAQMHLRATAQNVVNVVQTVAQHLPPPPPPPPPAPRPPAPPPPPPMPRLWGLYGDLGAFPLPAFLVGAMPKALIDLLDTMWAVANVLMPPMVAALITAVVAQSFKLAKEKLEKPENAVTGNPGASPYAGSNAPAASNADNAAAPKKTSNAALLAIPVIGYFLLNR